MHKIDIFAAFYIREDIFLVNIAKIKRLRIKDALQYYNNAFKNWSKVTTPKLCLWYITTKSYAKYQLNMSERVEENCKKLGISYILVQMRHNPIKHWRNETTLELGENWVFPMCKVQKEAYICNTFKYTWAP